MDIRAGTSGYSYKGWVGPFYPEKTAPTDMLRFYAEHLATVEINNTFYRLPKPAVLEAWAVQVPRDFRFTIKASRRITHQKRLKDVGDETGYLLRTTATLGDRLGALLFQLPPNLRCDVERLEAFLALLPDGTPAAFEFRHPSWLDDAVLERLRARNFPLVTVDDEATEPAEVIETADWGYLRLRRPGYDPAELRRWAEEIEGRSWSRALVYFKHEDAGAGPRLARAFLDALGSPSKRAPAQADVGVRPPSRRRRAG